MRFIAVTLLILLSQLGAAQDTIVHVGEHHFQVDESRLLIVSHLKKDQLLLDFTELTGLELSLDDRTLAFTEVPASLNYSESYSLFEGGQYYTLYFSPLPLIAISATDSIVDEPKQYADFVYADSTQAFHSGIGIEVRGGLSQTFPKLTYDIEFWEDSSGEETDNVSLAGLRTDDDWILDALYNEPLRLRSHLAHKLWLDIHTPHYLGQEPQAKSGADVEFAELFLDGAYKGLYCISEQVDKKQLKLADYDDEIRGELYKGYTWGATTFSSAPPYSNSSRNWGGYEMKYPREQDITDWQYVHDFTDMVIHATDSQFVATIWSQFSKVNYIDYSIFLNLIRATDNTGKNIYLAKYDKDQTYFYVPWDLDGCLGTIYSGEQEDITDDLLGNGLSNRIELLSPAMYNEDSADRWFELRCSVLHIDSLIAEVDRRYDFLRGHLLYERERMVFPNYTFEVEDLLYTKSWLMSRVSFLDAHFGTWASKETPAIYGEGFSIYPNPIVSGMFLQIDELAAGTRIQVLSMRGEVLMDAHASDGGIDLPNLAAGEYLMIIGGEVAKFRVE